MADNSTRIVITAEDKTRQAFDSVRAGLDGVDRSARTIATTVAGMAGLGGILSGASIAAMVNQSIDAADAMNDLSQRIGIAVQDLAKYELAAKQSGTSMEAIARGVKGLAGSMLEHGDALKKAGITAKDADGAMRQLADLFARMPDGMEKTVLATKLFGKAGMDLIPMLNLGSKGLDESAQKSERYAAAMALLAPQADKFNDQMAEIAMSGKVVGLTLANEVTPKLVDISGAMAVAARESGMLTAALVGFGGVLSPLGVLYKGFMNTLDEGNLKILEFFNAGEKDGSRKKLVGDIARRNQEILALVPAGIEQPAKSIAASSGEAAKALKEWRKQYDELMKSLGGSSLAAKTAVDEFAAVMNRVNAKDSGVDASFWKDLNTLHAGYKAGRVDADAYADAVRNLTNQQGFAKDAAKAAAEIEETIWKAREKAREEAERSLVTLQGEIEQQQRHNEEIGLTAAGLADLADRRMQDAIATTQQEFAKRQAEGADLAELKLIDEQIGALEKLRRLKSDGAVKQAAADSAKQAADEWKRFSDDIERALTDSLMRGFENGESFGKNFVKSLRNMLKTAALKVVVQAIVDPVMGDVRSMMGLGESGEGKDSGGGMNLFSMADPSKWSGMSPFEAWDTLGDSYETFSNLTESGLGMFDSAKIALDGTGKAFGSMAGYASAVFDVANGSYGKGIGSAIGTMFGGAPGGMIGSFIGDKVLGDDLGGLVQEAGGPQQGQYGTIDAKGYKSSYTMSGGDTLQNESLAKLAFGQAATLLQMAGKSASGLTLGQGYKLDPSGSASGVAYRNISINGRTIAGGTFDGNSGGQWSGANNDGSGAANYLGKLSTEEIKKLVDAIGDPAFSATVAKLATNFDDLNEGITRYATAQATQQSLLSAMMTEQERAAAQLADAHQSLDSTFSALGQSVPNTSADFRDLVKGLDLTSQAGQETLAKLAGVSDAFLLVANTAAKTEQTKLGWQQKLDILEGKYTQTQLDRFMELAGTSDTATRALMQQVWAMQDQADAAKLSADALDAAAQKAAAVASRIRDLDIQLLDATGQTAAATAARRADALAALDNDQQRAVQQQIWIAQDAAAAQQELARSQQEAAAAAQRAADEQTRAQQQLVDGWRTTAEQITATIKALRGDLLGEEKSFAAAQADYAIAVAAAKAGDQAATGRLPELARAVVDLGKVNSATSTEQALLTARTVASLQDVVAGIGSKFGISIPGFAAGGDFGGGLRLVGENGPELEMTGPSRIFNFDQTRDMLTGGNDMRGMRQELIALRRELAALRADNSAENRAIASATAKTAKTMERFDDGDALTVRVSA